MVATEDKTYQGWTNYATWVTHLQLTNEEDIYNYWVSRAKATTHERYPDLTLADMLEHDLEELTARTMGDLHIVIPDGFVRGLLSDLLGWVVGQVNFREIAKDFLEEYEAQDDDGEDNKEVSDNA